MLFNAFITDMFQALRHAAHVHKEAGLVWL